MTRDVRGLAPSVEAALILPVLVLFIGLLLSLARLSIAEAQVGSAAAAGARAASLERTVHAAEAAATDTISRSLSESGLTCAQVDVDIDAHGVSRPVGSRATVRVGLACTVSLADISLPLIPGSVHASAVRHSPIDPLRGR